MGTQTRIIACKHNTATGDVPGNLPQVCHRYSISTVSPTLRTPLAPFLTAFYSTWSDMRRRGCAGSYVKWMPALLLPQQTDPNDDQPSDCSHRLIIIS